MSLFRWVGVGLTGLALALGGERADAQSAPAMRWIPAHSSNYSARSSRYINKIVIHTVEGSESSCVNWFQNSRANVSAHFVVSHAGRITRMVQDKNVAWHVRNYNSNSIGIENEGYAQRNTWTSAQYRALEQLVAYLCRIHNIPADRSHIQGHYELDPARRTDPGPYFDWSGFIRRVQALRNGGTTTTSTTTTSTTTTSTTSTSSIHGVQVTASWLNVRTGAWGTILGSIPRGARFVLTGRTNGSWREIYYAGRKAWTHGSYLQGASGTGVQITAGWLNVRTGPSTRYSRIGSTPSGHRHFQVSSSGSWRKIQFDRRTGWSHGNYLRRITVSR